MNEGIKTHNTLARLVDLEMDLMGIILIQDKEIEAQKEIVEYLKAENKKLKALLAKEVL